MWEDRIEHSIECRITLHKQDQRPHSLLFDRRAQRNMNRPKGGAPELFWRLVNDLSAEDKATKLVLIPLDIDPSKRLTPASPVRLIKRCEMARAMKNSSALRAVYEWFIKHMRDRRDEPFLYICIYPPDMAFAEGIAVPADVNLTDESAAQSDRLEHKVCTCACPLHRCKDAPPSTL